VRDIFVTIAVFSTLPFILRRPYVGILVWAWLGYMNPHRLAWGFATTLPFALIVALTTLVAFMLSKEPKRLPWTRETVVLLLFICWMFLTTVLALYPEMSWPEWDKVWRIQLMTFVTLMLITSKERLNLLMWVIVLSLGFYGVKGGIWVLSTGGAHRVLGPWGSFIGGNNEIGLALIMVIPLMRYLQLTAERIWIRYGMTAAMVLTFIAVLGTHSRGALVGIAAMGVFFILKTRNRFFPLLIMALLIVAIPSIMPEEWFARMHTIDPDELDNSATERLRAWGNAFELATTRFLGGGYNVLIRWGGRDAHSVYFEVLGEHGFVGLGLFLLLALLTWLSGSWIIRRARKVPELRWAADLARMVQVSIVGYGAAGAFLGLAYFDLIYHLVAVIVITRIIVEAHLGQGELAEKPEQDIAQPAGPPAATPRSYGGP